MAQYRSLENGGVYDTINDITIPPDTANQDWQDYLTWLGEGNTPDPVLTETAEYPEIWATLTFSDGDGKAPPGINLDGPIVERHLVIDGDIRLYKDVPESVITQFTNSFRITIRKIVSEFEDTAVDSYSIVIGFTNGVVSSINNDPTKEYYNSAPGVYEINEDDFAIVDFYGTLYKVRLADNPAYFKVYP